MTATTAQAIGIDVGGTKTAALRVTSDGEILDRAVLETPSDDMAATLDTMVEAVKSVLSPDVRAIGVGAAGLVEAGTGRLIFAPNLAWRNVLLTDHLWDAVGLPAFADNDNNVAAWGEYRHGAARGYRHVLFVGVGTGIGGGIIVDGRLLRGAHGFAGEIGHIVVEPGGPLCGCGNHGCWEQVASGHALTRAGRDAASQHPQSMIARRVGGDPSKVTGPLVTEAARAGDPVARGILARVGRRLGEGIAGPRERARPGGGRGGRRRGGRRGAAAGLGAGGVLHLRGGSGAPARGPARRRRRSATTPAPSAPPRSPWRSWAEARRLAPRVHRRPGETARGRGALRRAGRGRRLLTRSSVPARVLPAFGSRPTRPGAVHAAVGRRGAPPRARGGNPRDAGHAASRGAAGEGGGGARRDERRPRDPCGGHRRQGLAARAREPSASRSPRWPTGSRCWRRPSRRCARCSRAARGRAEPTCRRWRDRCCHRGRRHCGWAGCPRPCSGWQRARPMPGTGGGWTSGRSPRRWPRCAGSPRGVT